MSHFEAKMHQIRFRLGLRPRSRWGSLQRSPRPLAGFKGSVTWGDPWDPRPECLFSWRVGVLVPNLLSILPRWPMILAWI